MFSTASQRIQRIPSSLRRRSSASAQMTMPGMVLLLSVIALTLIGLVMVYSASTYQAVKEGHASSYYLRRHLVYVVLGVFIAFGLTRLDHHVFESKRLVWTLWALELILLLLTAAAGISQYGAKRWLNVGFGTIQASEFAKVVILVIIAGYLADFLDGGIDLRELAARAGLAVLIPTVLIANQPDLGTALIILVTVLSTMWVGEIDYRLILGVLGIAALIAIVGIIIEPYRLQRILSFLGFGSSEGSQGGEYQVQNSLYALGSGGFLGSGLGHSGQKYGYLPEGHTDFIFAIIGEELGLLGTLLVVALFITFVAAGLRIAYQASTPFSRMVAGGATVVIGVQAFLNMYCVVGMCPVTGKPLPFVSSGGSSLLSTFMLVGLLLAISLQSTPEAEARRSRADLVVYDGSQDDPGETVRVLRSRRRGATAGRTGSASSTPQRFWADWEDVEWSPPGRKRPDMSGKDDDDVPRLRWRERS